jgi:hypothetical protein
MTQRMQRSRRHPFRRLDDVPERCEIVRVVGVAVLIEVLNENSQAFGGRPRIQRATG